MSLTYTIADLHGRFDLLLRAFNQIAADRPTELRKIITLGDYIDRGPQSREIIEFLMRGQRDGIPLICLRGNHEEIMVETIRKPLAADWWFGNGGWTTMASYGQDVKAHRKHVGRGFVPEEHLTWMHSLPLMYLDVHRIYVHAGVDPTIALNEQREDRLTWMLYPREFGGGHGARHVVHGHQQYGDGPLLHSGRTDLDTFAWATGRLVVGVFDDDKPGGPIDLIEVLGDPAPGYSRESKGY